MPCEGTLEAPFVPFFGDITLENLAFVIDSTPKKMSLAVDLHKRFIEVPVPMMKALHS